MGLVAFFFGFMAILYGYSGYSLGLTNESLAMMLMYFIFGIAGIFAYPAALVMDRLPGYQKDV